MANVLPSVTGLTARLFGSQTTIGSTTRYYQVQAIYPDGRSGWAYITITDTPASISPGNQVLVSWNASPGAIGYDVVQTTTSAAPTGTATIGESVGQWKNSFSDIGLALFSYTAIAPTTYLSQNNVSAVAHFLYSFAVDGGAVSTITPVNSDTIPTNAFIVEAFILIETALAGTSGGTVSVGIGSTNNSLLAATAYGTLNSDTFIAGIPQTTPFQLAAAAQITIGVAVHALTAGIVEGWVRYYPASAALT